jgi:small subunit ribosomal protein S10
MKKKEMIQVRLESFRHELLDSSYKKIITVLQNVPLESISLASLPTTNRIFCVLRSPHVDKDSREHFEIRTHKRVLTIVYNTEFDVVGLLSKTSLPSGVTYRIAFKDL